MNVKIYNCFHNYKTKPTSNYHSAIRPFILCGSKRELYNFDNLISDYYDNVGDNISDQNNEYSELTGIYWIWKNDEDSDIIGIEHYRRHFIKHHEIFDKVLRKDLFNKKDICDVLKENDFIIPTKSYMLDYTLYDLFIECFGNEFTNDLIKYMKKYFTEHNMKLYIDALYFVMSHNILVRGNMFITSKQNFCEYCEILFNMIDYLKLYVKPLKNKRTWGYVGELMPFIYVIANNKKYKEIDIATEDYNTILNTTIISTTYSNYEGTCEKQPEKIIEILKKL